MASESRPARWAKACADARAALDEVKAAYDKLDTAFSELQSLKEEYEEWQGNLPENLQQSALGEKLDAIVNMELEIDTTQSPDDIEGVLDGAENADLPRGFGKD